MGLVQKLSASAILNSVPRLKLSVVSEFWLHQWLIVDSGLKCV
uniref:Uncharacterized protein n=1 Tax=Arundo donax TaxID=35708 RepID=A0A0A9EQL3_ARUDO